MASLIRIKRSGTSGAPSTLKLGEIAYSHLAHNGSNGGDTLYIGAGTVDGSGDAPVIAIGGKYYVDQITGATNNNTVSTIVKRDSSGNFSAGTITAALSGNATTASTLQTARTINGVSFNGSTDITITSSTTNALTIGTGLSGGSFNGGSAVTIAIDSTVATLTGNQVLTNKTFGDSTTYFQDETDTSKKLQFQLSSIAPGTTRTLTVPNVSGTIITTGDSATVTNTMLVNSGVTIGSTSISLGATATNLSGLGTVTATTFSGSLTGNASTATTLQVTRTINGVNFNGSADITITATATNALTIGTGLSGTSYNGGSAVTIAIDSTVATLTGTQTLTNKTLTDSTTFFQDESDNSKKLQFQLTSIATGTTRTLTIPNVNGTIITTGDSATVTNTMLVNTGVTIGSTSVSLGGTTATLSGLTSVAATTFTGALTGNASTATKWATGITLAITGDLSYTSPTFDGSGNVTAAGTLATVLDGSTNKVAGTFGSAGAVPVITVDAKGRVTAITTAATSSSLSIAGGTGSDTVVVGTDTLTFAGGTGVTTTVSNNQVSFAIGQAVGTTSNVTFNDLTVSGNLVVSGTTTTISTNTLDVTDINITVAKNAANAAAANGAGLTVDGANATFTYTSGDDRWNLNKNLNVTTVYGALSGNASTATALQTGRTISISGDLTYTSPTFDGSGNVTAAGTLATVNSNVGTFGSSTSVPVVTVNAKGLVTAVSTQAIPTATSSVLGLASFNSTDFTVTSGAVTINTVDGGSY